MGHAANNNLVLRLPSGTKLIHVHKNSCKLGYWRHTTIQLWDSSPPEPLTQPAQKSPDLMPFLDDDDLPLPFLEDVPLANSDDSPAPDPGPIPGPMQPPAADPPDNPNNDLPGAPPQDPPSPPPSDHSTDEADMATAPSSPLASLHSSGSPPFIPLLLFNQTGHLSQQQLPVLLLKDHRAEVEDLRHIGTLYPGIAHPYRSPSRPCLLYTSPSPRD